MLEVCIRAVRNQYSLTCQTSVARASPLILISTDCVMNEYGFCGVTVGRAGAGIEYRRGVGVGGVGVKIRGGNYIYLYEMRN